MGRMVVLAYKPHQGKERELRQLMRDHRDALLAKGLVTDMTPIHMKSESGVLVEVFEWRADEAVEAARLDSSVSSLWHAFEAIADFVKLADLQECQDPFANFDRIHLIEQEHHHHHHHKHGHKQEASSSQVKAKGEEEEAGSSLLPS